MVKIALIQLESAGSKENNLAKHQEAIVKASKQGAQIVCLQELFLTDYFCNEEKVEHFDLAEKIPGKSSDQISQLARANRIVLIASQFEKRGPGLFHNTTIVYNEEGNILGKYRKMHIPEDPGFHEKFYFTEGDLGYVAIETSYGKIGVLICWDQWFPEAVRLTALQGAKIIFFPTAIGWLPEEKERLGFSQHNAWETVQKGHGVANGCFIAAVNRVGKEKGTQFWGQSFVSNPYGEIIAKASPDNEEILICEVDLKEIDDFRKIWPFYRDRRLDSYTKITKRWIDA
jgi:N-carbamoylputrescine amidase|tara:strand:- start:261 stop:1121 length:861 start_codon:yes stop_codon:yes gene_type:complete